MAGEVIMQDSEIHDFTFGITVITRQSTQKAQTSLPKADHYPHIDLSLNQPALHPELSGCITTLIVRNGGCKLWCSNRHLDRSRCQLCSSLIICINECRTFVV